MAIEGKRDFLSTVDELFDIVPCRTYNKKLHYGKLVTNMNYKPKLLIHPFIFRLQFCVCAAASPTSDLLLCNPQ